MVEDQYFFIIIKNNNNNVEATANAIDIITATY